VDEVEGRVWDYGGEGEGEVDGRKVRRLIAGGDES
jgi:hypothetical protein